MKSSPLYIILFATIVLFSLNNIAQSHKIKVYFNNSVDNNASNLVDANQVSLRDTIIAYINRTQTTLDVCNYNTGDIAIVNAINNAKARGITVRYIGAHTTIVNNSQIGSLSSSIPLIQRPNDNEIMHNKFMIFDVGNASRATIMSGSTNHTNGSLTDDYNNIIFIQDQPLALAYKTEFEEMWGSTTNTPNPANAKFGDAKTDNTPHNFIVDGIAIELYFSPSDGTESKIVNALNSANSDINFAMLTYTANSIGDAMIDKINAGVIVRGIIHNTSYFGSEYNSIVNAGADVISTQTNSTITHHKYAIIDANDTTSNPIVLTGSHNWSNSAEDDFDENLLIIHDKYVAHEYLEEFLARRPLTPTSIEENTNELNIFPNPFTDHINLLSNQEILSYQLIDNLGRTCIEANNLKLKNTTLDLSQLPVGIYNITITTQQGQTQQLITKQ